LAECPAVADNSDTMTRILDALLLAFVVPAAALLKGVRRIGLQRLPWCRAVLLRIGVLPVRNHYYEPFVAPRMLRTPLDRERHLPGIDWNLEQQLALLDAMNCAHELAGIGTGRSSDPREFKFDNGSFGSGDAEYLYQLIRLKKPRRIVEIGSGHSTLMAQRAVRKNLEEAGVECRHICIEPYEAPWLERAGVTVIRQRVEESDRAVFSELDANDLLFIDSSHIIRPQGDVLTEYLEILPTLRTGVIVHVHDVFSPRDYLADWVTGRVWLWNEQYLLEAFLTDNRAWKIIGALNLLQHRDFAALRRVCPYLTPEREPGSFYIQKIG
jgi:hypothetical protein